MGRNQVVNSNMSRNPGTLDPIKVNCAHCKNTRWFGYMVERVVDARNDARTAGWTMAFDGWLCPKCSSYQERSRGQLELSLDTFRHLSRNRR